jgi:hypothetical protein
MIVEVGKTYVNRAGSICKVLSRTDHPSVNDYYSYFPLENGREVREQAFHVDRFGSHLEHCASKDLIMEYKMPDLQWVWGTPDKVGIWAYGGNTKHKTPEVVTVDLIENMKGAFYMTCWRCYLGPIPQITQPKKLVKQTLWMVKRYANLLWEELWLPDEEVPKTISYQDVVHKTTTTRTV